MPLRDDVLKSLCLAEHPFSPERDPIRNREFRDKKLSLLSTLKMFDHPELADYYVRVGGFDQAAKRAEDALDANHFPTPGQQPPVVLIQGNAAVGRSSFAEYLAYRLRAKWEAAFPGNVPTLQRIKIEGENIARLMYRIKIYLRDHTDLNSVAGAARLYKRWEDDGGANEPNESQLESLFGDLADAMQDAPPLILIIRTITYERMGWIARLGTRLTAMNVIPIFITDSRLVSTLVANEHPSVVALALAPLDSAQAQQFVEQRINTFRKPGCAHGHKALDPFDPITLTNAFEGRAQGLGVRFFIEVMCGAFEEFLKDLGGKLNDPGYKPASTDLLVQWRHVSDGYRRRLSPGGQ